MLTYDEKMEKAVRIADGEITMYTRDEVPIVKKVIRQVLKTNRCTKKMLDDFYQKRLELAIPLVRESLAEESKLDSLRKRPDNHGNNSQFALALETASEIDESVHG